MALLLRTGSFQWFNDDNYKTIGHISPLSRWVLKRYIYDEHLEIVEEHSFGDPFKGVSVKWRKLRMLDRFMQKLSSLPATLQGKSIY